MTQANNPTKIIKFMVEEGYITPEEADLLGDIQPHFH